eukprot:6863107-Pyramimonas_sp.AAC.1
MASASRRGYSMRGLFRRVPSRASSGCCGEANRAPATLFAAPSAALTFGQVFHDTEGHFIIAPSRSQRGAADLRGCA